MKTALVTGGAGFIGSHMVASLLSHNYHVIVLDNLSTGIKENIPKGAVLVKADTRKKNEVLALCKKYSFDVIFHIAGQASHINAYKDPEFDLEENYLGSINVADAAHTNGVRRLLYASSMTVYGPTKTIPISEDHPCVPISFYGISKYSGERFLHATGERTDGKTRMHVTSFRMFNVYGPRQSLDNPYQGVMGIFIGNILRGEPITIFGDGQQSRDFIYIDDVVGAWIQSVDKPKTFGEVFNLGLGKRTSVNVLIKNLIKACGKDPKTYPLIYKDRRPGEQMHMQASMHKMKRLVAFVPSIPLQEGLKQTMLWAKNDVGA